MHMISLVLLVYFVLSEKIIGAEELILETNVTSVLMGRSIQITAYLDLKSGISAKNYLLLPYVNHHRWGAQQHSDSNGKSTFLIPLPNPGVEHIQVIAVKAEPDNWMGTSDPNLLIVGRLMPNNEVCVPMRSISESKEDKCQSYPIIVIYIVFNMKIGLRTHHGKLLKLCPLLGSMILITKM